MAAAQLMALKVPEELFLRVRACSHRQSLAQNREVRWTTFVRETLSEAVEKAEQQMVKETGVIRF